MTPFVVVTPKEPLPEGAEASLWVDITSRQGTYKQAVGTWRVAGGELPGIPPLRSGGPSLEIAQGDDQWGAWQRLAIDVGLNNPAVAFFVTIGPDSDIPAGLDVVPLLDARWRALHCGPCSCNYRFLDKPGRYRVSVRVIDAAGHQAGGPGYRTVFTVPRRPSARGVAP